MVTLTKRRCEHGKTSTDAPRCSEGHHLIPSISARLYARIPKNESGLYAHFRLKVGYMPTFKSPSGEPATITTTATITTIITITANKGSCKL